MINAVTCVIREDSSNEDSCRDGIPEAACGFHWALSRRPRPLLDNPQKTVLMAMPLDVTYEQGLSATALILEGELPSEAVSLKGIEFLTTFKPKSNRGNAPSPFQIQIIHYRSSPSIQTEPGVFNPTGPFTVREKTAPTFCRPVLNHSEIL